MNRDRMRLIVLCVAFFILDALAFSKSYEWYAKREMMQNKYAQALEQYETATAIYDEYGLSAARNEFREVSGYKDSDAYASKIDEELEKIMAYDAAVTLCNEKKYAAAFASFQPILDYRNVSAYVTQAASDVLSEARRLFQEGKYEEAQAMIAIIPEYATEAYAEGTSLSILVNERISELDLKEKYATAVQNYERENYKAAISGFMALKDYAESKDYLEKIGELLYLKTQALYEQGAYGAAIQCASDINQAGTWSGYLRAVQLSEDIKNHCVEEVLKEAEKEYYGTHNIEEVIRILNACEKEIGKDTRISNAINDYKNNSIVYLSDMSVFSYGDDGETVNKYLKSNYGETYKNSVTCSQGYVSYLIDGKGYSVFKGIVGCPEGLHSDSFRHGAYIEIIGAKGDEQKKLYVTKEITDASKPADVEVDISGYEVIYFKWYCKGANIWSDWGEFATIFEGRFMR